MATEENPKLALTAASPGTLTTKPSNDSSLTAASVPDVAVPPPSHDAGNPFSAFYTHGSARRSRDDVRTDEKVPQIHIEVSDLEAQSLTRNTTQSATPKRSIDGRVKECTMWPSRQTLQAQEKKRRKASSCNPMVNMSPKQKLWIKILIGLLVVAAAVGLGVGISRAVGGGVWAGNGKSTTIPNSHAS